MSASAAAGDDTLVISLEFAVPLHMLEVRHLPEAERHRLAREASAAVGSQGDTLMYGSASTQFGRGAKEMAKHEAHEPGKDYSCHVCTRGQAQYSPGEVFSFLARGLAIAAFQPGGITFAGLHWCAESHPGCPCYPPDPVTAVPARVPCSSRPFAQPGPFDLDAA